MAELMATSRRIAYVRWVDSTSYGAIHKDDIKPRKDYIDTSGIIVYEDKDEIQLAMYFNHTPDHYTSDVTIPKECIKKVRRFKID